ncbi:sialidase family protein [Streptomyces hygroscopicus]|uniref:sialidase family protein n=1 Tax=Streptomyces hygroscopicus TaxID=1912 RepID=UPI003F1BE906
MYSNDDGRTWKFAKGSPFIDRSSEPSLVEWDDKLIMSCRREDDMRRFYESSDMGNTWAESYDKLSRVWGNAPDRKGPGIPGNLIAVNIDGMRVMLFILPLNTKTGKARDRLNLWMTDNNRIFNVGQVSHW